MGIFREVPPTAGFPLYARDFLPLFLNDGVQCLEDDFKHFLNVPFSRVAYSGTAAFYLILQCLKELSGKKTVIIPSFICPLVPLAVKRAGLRVEVCDINQHDFSFDAEMLEALCSNNPDVLAILSVHLAGIPMDFDDVSRIAAKYGIFTIEDCAQSMGASYKGKKVGTLGDFSFFSLCRGKGMTTYEGGIIVANKKEHACLLDRSIERIVRRHSISEAVLALKLFGYAIFYRPLFFWFVFRLPQIFWNMRRDKVRAAMEDFDSDFPVYKMSAARQLIGHSQFLRLQVEIERQRRKAMFYIERLRDIRGIKILEASPNAIATYPYMTLIFDDPQKRGEALRTLEKSGYGGSFVYALAITDYGYLKDIVPDRNCDNARYLAERTVTLSTNVFLKDEDVQSVIDLLRHL